MTLAVDKIDGRGHINTARRERLPYYGGREGSPACGTAKGGRLERHIGRPWRRLKRHVAARGGSLKLLSRDFE